MLGLDDGVALFAIDLDAQPPEMRRRLNEQGRIATLREAGRMLPPQEAALAAYLVALLNWHRRHRFCPACGVALRVSDAGFSRVCPGCGAQHFPRTDPAVIVLVEHDGRALLGRQAGWPPGQYSVLAGFVGPGESLEEAVIREVKEESGITVHDPRFITSQPWPFPLQVMLGFEARADGGVPAPHDGELEDVRWFTREEVGAGLAGQSSRPGASTGDLDLVFPRRALVPSWRGTPGRLTGNSHRSNPHVSLRFTLRFDGSPRCRIDRLEGLRFSRLSPRVLDGRAFELRALWREL